MDMSKELMEAILEAAKEAGVKVKVHAIKSKEDLENLNINETDEKPFLKADKKYLMVKKVEKNYETTVNGLNSAEVIASIVAIIDGLEKKAGIPRAITLSALLVAMED